MLIEQGVVNINERDDKGSTPAHKGTASLLTLFKLWVTSEKNRGKVLTSFQKICELFFYCGT